MPPTLSICWGAVLVLADTVRGIADLAAVFAAGLVRSVWPALLVFAVAALAVGVGR